MNDNIKEFRTASRESNMRASGDTAAQVVSVEAAAKVGLIEGAAALSSSPTFKTRVDDAVAQCEQQLTRLKEVQATFEANPQLVGVLDNLYAAFLI